MCMQTDFFFFGKERVFSRSISLIPSVEDLYICFLKKSYLYEYKSNIRLCNKKKK